MRRLTWACLGLLALTWAHAPSRDACTDAGGDSLCSASEASNDTMALLQTPKHRSAARARIGVVHMSAENSTKPRKRAHLPERKAQPETSNDCQELTALLQSVPDWDEVENLFSYICRDEGRDMLNELRDGCLYLPADEFIAELYDVAGDINPWHLYDMLEDSFFPAKGLPCPSDVPGSKASSLPGTAVMTCTKGYGFQGTDGECVSAQLVGQTSVHTSNVRVYRMQGLMGLDETWEDMLASSGARDDVGGADHKKGAKKFSFWPWDVFRSFKKQLKEWTGFGGKSDKSNANSGPTPAPVPPPPAVQMRVRYYVCDPGDGSINSRVTDQMLTEQTDVLNRAYSGRDRCESSLTYTPSYTDTSFRFVQDGIVRLTDSDCASDCSERIPELTSKFAKRENGLIKVVLCDTQLLGIASFPGYPEKTRACLINYNTLPGGALSKYNSGKTAVHEVGHYLGCFHTFQGGCNGGDGIADTNAEKEPGYGCPTWHPPKTCGKGKDPIHNFMDYSDDKCMCTFTNGQMVKMWDGLRRYQPDLLRVSAR